MPDNQLGSKKFIQPAYVHQSWPKMVYHKETGEQLVVNSKKEIPEDYTTILAHVGKTSAEIKALDKLLADDLKKADEAAEEGRSNETQVDDVEITLDDLGISSKEEAIDLLREAEIKIPAKASAAQLAKLCEKLLGDEDVHGD